MSQIIDFFSFHTLGHKDIAFTKEETPKWYISLNLQKYSGKKLQCDL